MSTNPYLPALIPLMNLMYYSPTPTIHEQQTALLLWRAPGLNSLAASHLSYLVSSWLAARDALINTFLARTLCSRCAECPLIFPASYTAQLGARHHLPKAASARWECLLKAMDVPPEMLSVNDLEGFAREIWEIERAFVEGLFGAKSCGRASWCGYRDEVEFA